MVFLASLLAVSPVRAATIDVPTEEYPKIQTAIDKANDGDVIRVAQGTYYEHLGIWRCLELTIEGGWDAGFTSRTDDASLTIIDGDNSDRVLYISPYNPGTSPKITIRNMTLQNGRTAANEPGGCIRAGTPVREVSLTLMDVVLQDCEATTNSGGALYLESYSHPLVARLENVVVRRNNTIYSGGGIEIASLGIEGPASVTAYIVNSLIYDNVAGALGGGIAFGSQEDGSAHLVILNSTITNNTSNSTWLGGCGGVAITDAEPGITTAEIYNSIIYGNTPNPGADVTIYTWNPASSTEIHYSDIGELSHYSGAYNNSNLVSADPLFLDPANKDFHLGPASPCIDTGTTAVPYPPGLPVTDIEGNLRISGAAPDMGAYEFTGGGVPPPMVIDFSPESFSFFATEGGANPASQTLEVWNSGAFTFDWSVTDDADWLLLSPPGGSSAGEHDDVTVSVNTSGMGAGSYDATITISAPLAVNHPQTVPVSLTINPAGAGIAWIFPSTSDVFLGPTPDNGRPYLDAAVPLPTGTEPAELSGVYWLDEATGGWQYFIPGYGGSTLTSLEPGQSYLIAVCCPCSWNLPCGEGSPWPTGDTWDFPSTSAVFLGPTPANGRPYLDAAVPLPTGTEPAELSGVYWLDEATGGWQYFIPGYGGSTLTSLEPDEAYLLAVSGACSWNLQ